jgi:hypothetical protein
LRAHLAPGPLTSCFIHASSFQGTKQPPGSVSSQQTPSHPAGPFPCPLWVRGQHYFSAWAITVTSVFHVSVTLVDGRLWVSCNSLTKFTAGNTLLSGFLLEQRPAFSEYLLSAKLGESRGGRGAPSAFTNHLLGCPPILEHDPASVSPVLELQACTTMPGLEATFCTLLIFGPSSCVPDHICVLFHKPK